MLAAELPDSIRTDERWTDVLAAVEAYEQTHGPEDVRLVVWFED